MAGSGSESRSPARSPTRPSSSNRDRASRLKRGQTPFFSFRKSGSEPELHVLARPVPDLDANRAAHHLVVDYVAGFANRKSPFSATQRGRDEPWVLENPRKCPLNAFIHQIRRAR